MALRDYRLQMAMVGHLARQAPAVPVALHAGELAPGLVPPEHLQHHIADAVRIAGARRIGHAVDIGQEDGAAALLAEMKSRPRRGGDLPDQQRRDPGRAGQRAPAA